MITIAPDKFQIFLMRSVRKFFKEATLEDSDSNAFNTLYDCRYSYDQKDFESALDTYKGVIYIEQRDTITEEYRKGSKTFNVEVSPTEVEYATGTRYNTLMTLRVQTDLAQRKLNKEGKIELLKMEGMMRKLLQNNESITVYNFNVTPETVTDLKIRWHSQYLEYTRIPLDANDYQQGVFEVPIWCDFYELDNYDRLDAYKVILDKQ